jgi:hypothetical protein
MKNDNRFYELRTYFASPGMLNRLVSRFENHTFRFFAKHKMQVMGLWVPIDNQENKLVYILSFADQQACEKSWDGFKNDAEWLAIKQESIRDGELVASLKSVFMHTLDFSPEHLTFGENHVFELQTYKNTPNNQDLLRLLFSKHNRRLFQKHGINAIQYWEASEPESEEANLLIGLLVHRLQDEGKEADESANGFLSGFIKSEYLRAVSFSPLK